MDAAAAATLLRAHTHLDTVVADGAVGAAGRPVEAAGRAPLHPDLDPPDLHRLVERSAEVVLLVLVLLSCTDTHKADTTLKVKNLKTYKQMIRKHISGP